MGISVLRSVVALHVAFLLPAAAYRLIHSGPLGVSLMDDPHHIFSTNPEQALSCGNIGDTRFYVWSPLYATSTIHLSF